MMALVDWRLRFCLFLFFSFAKNRFMPIIPENPWIPFIGKGMQSKRVYTIATGSLSVILHIFSGAYKETTYIFCCNPGNELLLLIHTFDTFNSFGISFCCKLVIKRICAQNRWKQCKPINAKRAGLKSVYRAIRRNPSKKMKKQTRA